MDGSLGGPRGSDIGFWRSDVSGGTFDEAVMNLHATGLPIGDTLCVAATIGEARNLMPRVVNNTKLIIQVHARPCMMILGYSVTLLPFLSRLKTQSVRPFLFQRGHVQLFRFCLVLRDEPHPVRRTMGWVF